MQNDIMAGIVVQTRVVAQPGARALCLCHPDQSLAFDHSQARQFACFCRHLIKDRLSQIVQTGSHVMAQSKHGEFQSQSVSAALAVLNHVTGLNQQGKQSVADAFG